MTTLSSNTSRTSLSLLRAVLHATNTIYSGFSLRATRQKLFLILSVMKSWQELRNTVERLDRCKSYGDGLLHPNILGLVEWPYIHNAWSVAERLGVVATHYELLDRCRTKIFRLKFNHSQQLADLGFVAEGCKIVIDRPSWFIREGELVLNIFNGDLRIVSIAFVLGQDTSGVKLILGAIQGIHSGVSREDSLLMFKTLTKTFEGMRPRSLLIFILRVIARYVGAERICAVADLHRHHRHRYFGAIEQTKMGTDYDEIWLDHGGVLDMSLGFYQLPMEAKRKEFAEIPSHKRAMYRRRYEILQHIEHAVLQALEVN